MFNELDVDGDNDISLDELEVFLRRIFILQRDEILRVVRRKWHTYYCNNLAAKLSKHTNKLYIYTEQL